jgi:hypothetical protein
VIDRASVAQSCEEELRNYMSSIGSAAAPPSIPECRSGALLEIWKSWLVDIKVRPLGRLTYLEGTMYNSSQTVRNAWGFFGDPGRVAKGSNEFMQNVTLTKTNLTRIASI